MHISPWTVFLTAVALPALAAERPPPPPLFMEPVLSDIGGWALGFNPKLEGCVAARQFDDRTSFWTGYSAEGPTSFPYIGFTNASWNIEPGKTYTLRVVLRGVRGGNIVLHGDFTGIASRESGFVGSIKHTNLEDIAAADSVELTRDGQALSNLDLEGSRNAITEVVRCQKQAPQLVAAAKERERTEATASGTGFFVAEGGYILTNEHVAGRCDKLDVNLPDGEVREATLVKADSENDLALVTTVKGGAAIASFAHLARLGEAAYAFGYPLAGLLSSSGSFTGGNVNSLEGIGDDGRMLQISTPIQPGNSGGPLLDASGNVIGVVRSKANAIAIARITSDISQNVNFAVKSEVAAGFLRSVGIEPTMARQHRNPQRHGPRPKGEIDVGEDHLPRAA